MIAILRSLGNCNFPFVFFIKEGGSYIEIENIKVEV
jgi:hypothetical protein